MDTNQILVQRAQHSALRIPTGLPKIANICELLQAARKLLVRQHKELISQQFALASHLPQYPSHHLCHRPPDDRPDRLRSLIGWY